MSKKELVLLKQASVGFSEPLLSPITESIRSGEAVALLGSNGSGKTTILKTIAGLEDPFSGSVSVRGTVILIPQILSNTTSGKSGGEEMIHAVDQALLQRPDILLLDEPTNHLDSHNKNLLLEKLLAFDGAIICISHDISFITKLTNKLWIIEHGMLVSFSGTYTEYQELQSNKESALLREREVVKKDLKKLTVAMGRERVRGERSKKQTKQQKADRSMGRMAQGRLKNSAENSAARISQLHQNKQQELHNHLSAVTLSKRKTVSAIIPATNERKSIFRVADATLTAYEKTIHTGISLEIFSGQRIQIAGDNGSGKSSLAKAIMNEHGFELSPNPYRNKNLSVHYLDQHYSIVDPVKTVLENAMDYSGSQMEHARQHLSHFLFHETLDVHKKASMLSGGMTARLAFAMITLSPIDLLILDEPTNNLDYQTIDDIIEILNEFTGAIIIISHNEYFVEKLGIDRVIDLK